MNIILDTCTINNLLQVDLLLKNENCSLEYDYLKRIHNKFKIKIPKKIYEELKNTFSKNLNNGIEKQFVQNYMSRYISQYVDQVNEEDFKSSLNFIKITQPKYQDEDNGELHLTAYALYLNRYQDMTAFQTHFVTDDDEAILDFKDFFKINFLGTILTTIDLLLLMSIYEIISLNDVLKFSYNLKKQYSQTYNQLIYEIKTLQKKELPAQEIAFLSRLHDNINDFNYDALKKDREHKLYKKIKNKKIEIFIKNFLNEDFNKVTMLEKKITEIKSQYWDLSKI